MDALGNLILSIKSGQEAVAVNALSGFIDKYPRVGDAYPLRASFRCVTGDLQGAKDDVEKGLTGLPRIFNDDPKSDRNELLAIHAKLALIARDDATTSQDLNEIINAYSDDFSYLTDGRVKITDKPTSQCAWTNGDVIEWLWRSHNTPEAQVFRGIFTAAFAPLDDGAKPLTERYATDAMQANPSFAPAYFYGAVGMQKIATFKALAYSDAQRSTYYDHLTGLFSQALR